MGHTRTRFFPPELGGVLFNSPLADTVFRIDHDQAFQQTSSVRYQWKKDGPWGAFTWRYDSGLVAGAVGTLQDAIGLTGGTTGCDWFLLWNHVCPAGIFCPTGAVTHSPQESLFDGEPLACRLVPFGLPPSEIRNSAFVPSFHRQLIFSGVQPMKWRLRVFAPLLLSTSVIPATGQVDKGSTLEQRQPLELVFADSIVPQEHHEMMLTTGGWYSRKSAIHDGRLTQKAEWGISDKLQISAFANPLHTSNSTGPVLTGAGDTELGARYTWVNVGSPFTHVALAMDAGLPSGNPRNGMGDGAWSLSPATLLSRELKRGRYQVFTTTGFEFLVARRRLDPEDEIPHHEFFVNSGFSAHAGHGWAVTELSVRNDRWSGGDETHIALTPSYVWRFATRSEVLFALPVGLTSSTDRIGGVVKFTFELGGDR